MLLTAAGAPARSPITLKTTTIAATINGHFRISFKAILHTLQPADKDETGIGAIIFLLQSPSGTVISHGLHNTPLPADRGVSCRGTFSELISSSQLELVLRLLE